MKYLRVRNLEKHQHYKDRRPPWIKLHAEVLDDYAFSRLQDASKAHLMLIWVLASRVDNAIPYDLVWITRQIGASGPIDLEELIAHGFIEVYDDASSLLASRKQSALPETETETETKKKKRPAAGATGTQVPDSWPARLATGWSEEVGPVTAGRVGAALKPAVDRHGAERVERAMRAYIAVQKADGKTPKFSWFVEQSQVWIERTANPLGVVDGEMSDTLELLTRPAKGAA